MKSLFKSLVLVALVAVVILPLAGCEERTEDDYERYVSVEMYSYTKYAVDVYTGNAFYCRLEPGENDWYSKGIYPDEKIKLNFIIHSAGGPIEVRSSFDDDYRNYHVNIYDGWIERY